MTSQEKLERMKLKITIVKKSVFRNMRWANGGGATTELFAHVDERTGRSLWRISIATASSDGPFSEFANCDRVLILLNGEGIRLEHEGGLEDYLSHAFDMATFPGDVVTSATLKNGPVRVFNVIADRSEFRSEVSVLLELSNNLSVNTDVLAAFALDQDLTVSDPDGKKHNIVKGDLLLASEPPVGQWTFSGATAIVTQIARVDKT